MGEHHGQTMTLMNLGVTFVSPYIAALSDRFGRRRIMYDALPEGNGAGGFADQRGDVRNYRDLHRLHAF